MYSMLLSVLNFLGFFLPSGKGNSVQTVFRILDIVAARIFFEAVSVFVRFVIFSFFVNHERAVKTC